MKLNIKLYIFDILYSIIILYSIFWYGHNCLWTVHPEHPHHETLLATAPDVPFLADSNGRPTIYHEPPETAEKQWHVTAPRTDWLASP